jgi:hypothetical protein
MVNWPPSRRTTRDRHDSHLTAPTLQFEPRVPNGIACLWFGASRTVKPFLMIIGLYSIRVAGGRRPDGRMLMMTNVERVAVTPRGSRRVGEEKPANQVERSPKPVTAQQFHVIDNAQGDTPADAKPFVPAVRKANRQLRRQTFVRQAAHPSMADDVKNAFTQLIEQCEACEEAAHQERQRAGKAEADFENAFRSVMEQIIVPTLNEVGSLLRQSRWTCKTVLSSPDTGVGVTFEASRPAMKAVADRGLPHITFSSVPEHQKVGISSFSGLSGNGRPEYRLEEISSDFVARQTLLFFRQLTNDWTAGGF